MLNRDNLLHIINDLINPDFGNKQVIMGNGYDAIIDILQNVRTVEYPAFILECRDSGYFHVVEGAVDFHSQSIWIMGVLERDEDEAALYEAMFQLAKKVISRLLKHRNDGCLSGWQPNRISYMKRYGGPNSRGWELILNFNEDISLIDG